MKSLLEEYLPAAESTDFAFEKLRFSRFSRFSRFIAATFDRSREEARTSIMLTSPLKEAGVSFICCSIAAELAQRGERVLLVDAHALVAARTLLPLTVASLCRRVGSHSLWVLGSKEIASFENTHVRHEEETCCSILRELERDFTYVLIDAPALTAALDAELLSSAVYGTVLVVRSGSTSGSDLTRAHRRLTAFGGRVLGTLFNAH